jgi:hypothetical protein
MKKLLLLLSFILVLLSIFLGACNTNTGPSETKQFSYIDFTNVQVGSAFEVEIAPSDAYSVSVTAPEKLFQYIKVEKTGDSLEASINWGGAFWRNWGFKRPKILIAMPTLNVLDVSGASLVTAKGFKSAQDFQLGLSGASTVDLGIEAYDISMAISGASHLNGQLQGHDIRLNISGASSVDLSGVINNMNLQVSGASHATLDNLTAKDARVELSGASHATTAATGKLDVFLSGASTLEYTDSPTLGTVDITGASSVHKK